MIDDLIVVKPGRAQVDETNVGFQDVTTELAPLHLALGLLEENQGGFRYYQTAINQIREVRAQLMLLERRLIRMKTEEQTRQLGSKRAKREQVNNSTRVYMPKKGKAT